MRQSISSHSGSILYLTGLMLMLFAVFAGCAGWSFHANKRSAHEICLQARPGHAAERFRNALKNRHIDFAHHADAGSTATTSIPFKTLMISRFVCVVNERSGRIQDAQVVYVD
ncbi:hypothetical protein N8I74_00175 [Chitiniphilus purpureus]|uniref:Lipoprotein n=1 Tax=Chitiniphilus purpureus TaxID=2981137 RepID=A0ABY6DN71_9NEIS|nr:hypothetical protein [Chitiniphilus sp. CD1]UXY15467.1 hypothetical protein N8I74_00175 [Chitiniphilus sp. CD1]